MINERIKKKLSYFQKKEIKIPTYEICKKHQQYFYKICITCKKDICSQCEKEHVNHYMIKQEEIMPDMEEIKKIQFGIQNYISDVKELINEIKKWLKDISEKILLIENNIKNNIILNSVDFIDNFSNLKLSLNSIIKFRRIYSMIIEPEGKSKNSKILSFLNEDNFISKQNNIYEYNKNTSCEYNDYLAMKYLIKDINNLKDNFVKKSKKIIEYLYRTSNNKEIIDGPLSVNKKHSFNHINNNYLYKYKNKSPLVILNKSNNFFKAENIQKNINKISIENKYNKSYDNNIIFKRLSKAYNSKNNQFFLKNGNNSIYSKKNNNRKEYSLSLNNTNSDIKYDYNLSTLSSNNDKNNNNNTNKIRYHSSNDLNSKKLYPSLNNSNHTNKQMNTKKENSTKNNISISDRNSIKELNNIKGKTYIHKKFILNKEKGFNQINKIILNKLAKNNFIQKEKSYENIHSKTDTNTITNTYITHNNTESTVNNKINLLDSNTNNNNDLNNFNHIINIPISFSNNNNNTIKSSIFNKNISPFKIDDMPNKSINNTEENKLHSQTIKNQIFYNQNNSFINKAFDINIIKSDKYEFIKIKNDKNINIGLDLGNIETKIGIIKNYNEIQLMCFSDNNYSIPTMISFNNNDTYIGAQTEELMVNHPSQTIFNIIKIFGHEYDEIINNNNKNHLLWPFKLFKDNFNKPYVKIQIKGEEKIYYFEEILVLFLKHLFELIFKKISIENIKNNIKQITLNLNLVVSIPNCFTFYQRKLLEKIFYSEIFPKNNSVYGGYTINLDKIGIEDRSSIACLCLKNNPNIKNNNILIVNLDSCCVDLSIISIYESTNKVIAVDSIELLNEDFNDNLINLCLKLLKKNNINIPNEFLYNDSLLSKLRKLSSNIIKNLTINEDAIFIIDNINNGEGNCVIKVNKIEYDEICFDLCKNIIISIKNILVKARLNENDINDILLIGDAININKLNQMIKELFINNKDIYEKLSVSKNMNSDDKNKKYYIAAGAALQAYNISKNFSTYLYKNIIPVNIGIESYDGTMDVIAQKNSELPLNIKKNIKIKNNKDNKNDIIIKVYEGKERMAEQNKLISQFVFNERDFKFNEENKKDYYDLLIEFEMDYNLNIKFFVNDNKTDDHLFKCEINIEKFKK